MVLFAKTNDRACFEKSLSFLIFGTPPAKVLNSTSTMIKVLIYEDNVNYQKSLVGTLGTCNKIQVVGSFGDCRFLREHIETYTPDLVLTDIDMPHVDGLQGLYILKQHFPAVKVLMLTIFDDSDKVFEAICLGADGYLLKDTAPQRLIDAILDVHDGGAPMTPAIAKKVITVFQRSGFKPPVDYDLSVREMEVLRLLVAGMSYKMIATEQHVSLNTIRTQVSSVYEKLRVHSVSEAVSKAIREQIV